MLIDKGANVNVVNDIGQTPLHLTCIGGYIDTFELLLEYGADPTIKAMNNHSLIHLAAKYGQLKILTKLVAVQSDVGKISAAIQPDAGEISAADIYGHTPLHLASAQGHTDIVEYILMHEKSCVDYLSTNQETSLHLAAANGHATTVGLLLIHSSKADAKTKAGETALILASVGGHESVVEVLLAKGVDTLAEDKKGDTALHAAGQRGYIDIVNKLLHHASSLSSSSSSSSIITTTQHRTSINKCNKEGVAPLHSACMNGHTAVVQLLVENGANINMSTNDILNSSPLHFACYHNRISTVQKLLEYAVAIEQMNSVGCTPLHLACQRSHTCIVELLLAAGASVLAQDHFFYSPLHYAAENDSVNIMKLLILWGGVSTKDNMGCTPVHLASKNGHVSILAVLLTSNNIDIDDIDDISNYTALHYACKYGHREAAVFLIDHGASSTNTDKNPFELVTDDVLREFLIELNEKSYHWRRRQSFLQFAYQAAYLMLPGQTDFRESPAYMQVDHSSYTQRDQSLYSYDIVRKISSYL